jgi:FMN reductase (NADPH)/FMN reductase [NAD(P)H]
MDVILSRKSVRAYEDRPVTDEVKGEILHAAMRAPTAGNMMLYSIIDVKDQSAKDTLARTCDDQPFIAKAPVVLLFLADYQRWWDYFMQSGVEQLCEQRGEPLRKPAEGDLFLACCDALIAAQTAVIAAESLGLGSCYIGDIMENYEAHRDLFALPRYVFPICLLCLGYPTQQQRARPMTTRFEKDFVVFEDRYRQLDRRELADLFRDMEERAAKIVEKPAGVENAGQWMYVRKFAAAFSVEMTRSVRAILHAWMGA